ncbi:MAG: hypothetical protein U1F98_15155 [Verrucomicrobiota bacterium]
MRLLRSIWIRGGLAVLLAGWQRPALGCAACYGQSDSPMAAGMNWGILVLLGVITLVLGGVTAFFVLVAARPAQGGETPEAAEPVIEPEKES